MIANTLFLRLEGPLQAWGGHESKFVVRRTQDMPTKSGVFGLLLCALGVGREPARCEGWLDRLAALRMGVREDRHGVRWWDYHTVGARTGNRTAEGKLKLGVDGEPVTFLTRREYLCDASFLVALQGSPELVAQLHAAVSAPIWTPYLGRKCCPPGRPLLEAGENDHDVRFQLGNYNNIHDALCAIPWRSRSKVELPPSDLACEIDWMPSPTQPVAPVDVLVRYDVPVSLAPPAYIPRFVITAVLSTDPEGMVQVDHKQMVCQTPAPQRARADYRNTEFRRARFERLYRDENLCVFCKQPATTVQHITYRRAGGNETQDDLRALCRLCHDAITMLEYGANMGLDRINPEDLQWREMIMAKRQEIITFRSREANQRRRQLGTKEDW